jgi:hypothetical protein
MAMTARNTALGMSRVRPEQTAADGNNAKTVAVVVVVVAGRVGMITTAAAVGLVRTSRLDIVPAAAVVAAVAVAVAEGARLRSDQN